MKRTIARVEKDIHEMGYENHYTSYNLWAEYDTETKLTCTSIDPSRRVAQGSRSSRLQTLGNQLSDRSPYIR